MNQPVHRQQLSAPEIGTPGTSVSAQGDQQQRFGTKWQETEQVTCPLHRSAAGGTTGEATLLPGENTLWFEASSHVTTWCLGA